MNAQPTPHPPEMRERAYKLFVQRIPLTKIGETLNIPVDTIRKWSSKGKWKTRRLLTGAGDCAPGKNNVMTVRATESNDIHAQLAKLIGLTFEEKQGAYREMMSNEALRAALSIQNVPSATLVQHADKVKKLDEVARKALNLEEHKPICVVNVALLARPIMDKRAGAISLPANSEVPKLQESGGCEDNISQEKFTNES